MLRDLIRRLDRRERDRLMGKNERVERPRIGEKIFGWMNPMRRVRANPVPEMRDEKDGQTTGTSGEGLTSARVDRVSWIGRELESIVPWRRERLMSRVYGCVERGVRYVEKGNLCMRILHKIL
ncbi:hypothetical protein Tco_0351939 [Tanacetum coccineum]